MKEHVGVKENEEEVRPPEAPVKPTHTVASGWVVGRIEEHGRKEQVNGWVKLVILLFLPVVMAWLAGWVINQYLGETLYKQQKGVVVAAPMTLVNWQGFGLVFEPMVKIPIKTTGGYLNQEFLLDSGALVSSLPREWADKTGQDLAFLPRATFRGFGNTTSLAYQGEVTLKLGSRNKAIPVVFTEAGGTKPLLGRKGFFENYSVYFNHKEKVIEIRE